VLLPLFLFSIFAATAVAALFHLLFGSSLREFITLWLASILGFALGHFAGSALGVSAFQLGSLRLGPALAGCFLVMLLVRPFVR